jgi:hypothetical protein
VKLRGALPMSVGHRVLKQRLRAELLDGLDASFRYDEELKLYEALDAPALAALFEAKSTGATRPGRAPRGTSPGVAKPNSKRPKPRA